MRHFAVLIEASGLPGQMLDDDCDKCGFFTTAFVSSESAEDAGRRASLVVMAWFAKSFPERARDGTEPVLTIEEITEIAELPPNDAVRGATWFAEEGSAH